MAIKRKLVEVYLEELNLSVPIFLTTDSIEGKIIQLDLTRFLKGKNVEAKFTVRKKENNFFGDMISFNIPQAYVKRLIGNNISIIEDSFELKCTDSTMIFKPFLITRNKVHRSVKKELRKEAKKEIEEFSHNKSKKEVFSSVLNGILQKNISRKLKKIYPLGICELRTVKISKK
jgi:ribosomal protein S3AE